VPPAHYQRRAGAGTFRVPVPPVGTLRPVVRLHQGKHAAGRIGGALRAERQDAGGRHRTAGRVPGADAGEAVPALSLLGRRARAGLHLPYRRRAGRHGRHRPVDGMALQPRLLLPAPAGGPAGLPGQRHGPRRAEHHRLLLVRDGRQFGRGDRREPGALRRERRQSEVRPARPEALPQVAHGALLPHPQPPGGHVDHAYGQRQRPRQELPEGLRLPLGPRYGHRLALDEGPALRFRPEALHPARQVVARWMGRDREGRRDRAPRPLDGQPQPHPAQLHGGAGGGPSARRLPLPAVGHVADRHRRRPRPSRHAGPSDPRGRPTPAAGRTRGSAR